MDIATIHTQAAGITQEQIDVIVAAADTYKTAGVINPADRIHHDLSISYAENEGDQTAYMAAIEGIDLPGDVPYQVATAATHAVLAVMAAAYAVPNDVAVLTAPWTAAFPE